MGYKDLTQLRVCHSQVQMEHQNPINGLAATLAHLFLQGLKLYAKLIL